MKEILLPVLLLVSLGVLIGPWIASDPGNYGVPLGLGIGLAYAVGVLTS